MNSSKTEQRAITAIRAEIDKYPQLKHQLNENDKTISWDGDIFVFKTAEQTKKDFLGKVPVQLKGTTVQDINTPTISFPLDVADLSNYQKEQGCILFVVCFSSDSSDKSQIYYAELLPAQLSQLLKETPAGQKTKNIICQRLTQEPPDLEEICFDFIHNCNKQKGQPSQQVITIQQAQKLNLSSRIYLCTKPNNFVKNIFNRSHVAYAPYSIPGPSQIDIPIAEQVQFNSITKKSSLSIDDEIIIPNVKMVIKKETPQKMQIELLPSITIILDHSTKQINFHYHESGDLQERLKAARTMLRLSKAHQLSIEKAPLVIEQNFMSEKDQEYFEQRIRLLSDLNKVFSFFHVNEEINWDKLTDQCINNLAFLLKALDDPKHLIEIPSGQMAGAELTLRFVPIANLNILVLFQHIQDETYMIADFSTYPFKPENIYITYKGKNTPISRYSLLKQFHFERASNIPYDKVQSEFCNTSFSLGYARILTEKFLDMLQAYDKNHKPQLFEVLKAVNKYLLRHDSRNTSHIINKMQLIFRKRDLNRKEQQQLQQIQNTTNNITEKLAIAVLLQQPHIEQLYAKLSPEEKQAFNSWPISNLWIKPPDCAINS